MAKSNKEETKSKLQEVIDELNKDYGKGTVMSFSQKSIGNYDIISTGSINLDNALGIGGFAKGKLYELRSWEGGGKTTICGETAANCQVKGGKVAYIDGEHALDREYFTSLGVDVDNLLICQPDNGEQGFTVACKLVESGEIDLLIIDSDSSLIPQKVIEGDIGDANIGKKAKLNSDAYPKLKGLIEKYNTCCIVTSQYREKIGIMFGDTKTTQGGHALKFYADCIIEMTNSNQKEGDEITSKKVKAKTIKNKMAPPFVKAEFEILFGYGINVEKEIFDLAIGFGILTKYGKKITYEEKIYEMSSSETSIHEFVNLLRDNEELFLEIKSKVLEKLKS